ncbi:hypothetical protein R7127_08075 [Vibrio sp. 1159]|uniref:hypothetical protein n=1 Tax=Vibrio sp. 1159 TaxID=3074545 RepID=UPI00296482F3|nr:hypothetical protein [Vibrio sp. 1159]MDW2320236.1 hypothetical protein [Vibrio sp. 1159]
MQYMQLLESIKQMALTFDSSERTEFLKNALQRILNYKEIFVHKEQLPPSCLSNAFSSLKQHEQVICEHGIEAMNLTILYLDDLLGQHDTDVPEPCISKYDRQKMLYVPHVQ